MKKLRKLFGCLMIILALVVMQLPITEAEAATSVSDFSIDEEGVLTKYNGISSSVVIPSGVKTIATDAFKNNSTVVSVSIPNTVTKIDAYAFWNCSKLNSVTIGTGLEEIGDFAFANCKALGSMIVPSNIKRIGLYAFEDDINFTDITIPYQTMDIHETAFDGCSKLVIHAVEGSYAYKYAQEFYKRQQEFPEYEDVSNYNPNGNTSDSDSENDDADEINGSGANSEEDTSSSDGTVVVVTNPDGTGASYITGGYGNQLSSVHVVGNKAVIFMDSSSPTVYFGNQTSVNVEETSDGSNDGTGAGDGLGAPTTAPTTEPDFAYENVIPKYTIVDDKIVADQAYYCSNAVNYVVLPESIIEIGQLAYARSSVSSIVLPEGLERIDYGAFYHCDKLSSVTIPSTVTLVEPNAFTYSAWVEEFMSGKNVDTNAESASEDDATLNGEAAVVEAANDFLISGGVLVAYRGNAVNVVIPSGVRVIAAQVFEGHDEIETVAFPSSLTHIGEEAFANCKNLTEASLEMTSLEHICDRAFYNTAISSVKLPKTLKAEGINAFDDQTSKGYIGAAPALTHEATAERLSNFDYRKNAYIASGNNISQVEETGEVVVTELVAGGATALETPNVLAYLEGASERYYLTVTSCDPYSQTAIEFAKAFARAEEFIKNRSLMDAAYYDIELTDKSGIEISRLGHSALTIAIPVPDVTGNLQQLTVMTLDRNGQLEEIAPEIIDVDGVRYVRFNTYHLSPFALYGTGNLLEDSMIITQEYVFSALAAAPAEGAASGPTNFREWVMLKKWRLAIAAVLVVGGFVLIFTKFKRKN